MYFRNTTNIIFGKLILINLQKIKVFFKIGSDFVEEKKSVPDPAGQKFPDQASALFE